MRFQWSSVTGLRKHATQFDAGRVGITCPTHRDIFDGIDTRRDLNQIESNRRNAYRNFLILLTADVKSLFPSNDASVVLTNYLHILKHDLPAFARIACSTPSSKKVVPTFFNLG
jgi:hypothetical protein